MFKVPAAVPQEHFKPLTVPPVGTGRPHVPFEKAAPGTQRNRTAKLAQEKASGELIMASEKRALLDGEKDLAWVIKKMRTARWDNRCFK